MGDVLVVQNTRIEDSGYLGELLNNDGFDIHSIYAKNENIPKKNFSLVVILGAPESANDNHPYLREEEKLIRNCVEKNIPVLGICLGSQLIAKSFGARVYRGPKKEIGFYNDLWQNPDSKLFSGFKQPFTVFHWHGDTFDLPLGATRLAYSTDYQNQAFQIGCAIGLQFHLEVNEQMINLWLDKSLERQSETPHIDFEKIKADINTNMSTVKHNMKIFYDNFKILYDIY